MVERSGRNQVYNFSPARQRLSHNAGPWQSYILVTSWLTISITIALGLYANAAAETFSPTGWDAVQDRT